MDLYGQDDGFFGFIGYLTETLLAVTPPAVTPDSVTGPPTPGPPCPSPSHGFKFAVSPSRPQACQVQWCGCALASQPSTFRSFCTRPTAAGQWPKKLILIRISSTMSGKTGSGSVSAKEKEKSDREKQKEKEKLAKEKTEKDRRGKR